MPLYKMFGGIDRPEQMANAAVFAGLVALGSLLLILAMFVYSVFADEHVDIQARSETLEVSTAMATLSASFNEQINDMVIEAKVTDSKVKVLEASLVDLQREIDRLREEIEANQSMAHSVAE